MAQYPWLLPTSLSLAEGSAPVASLRSEIAVMAMAAVLVVPAFAYLYRLQQKQRLGVTESSQELRRAVRAENEEGTAVAPGNRGGDGAGSGGKAVLALVGTLAGAAVLRRLVSGRRDR